MWIHLLEGAVTDHEAGIVIDRAWGVVLTGPISEYFVLRLLCCVLGADLAMGCLYAFNPLRGVVRTLAERVLRHILDAVLVDS